MFKSMWVVVMGLCMAGCGKSVQFQTVDAESGQPLPGVELHRKRTKHYGSLRLAGETTVEMLGASNQDGRAAAGEVTGDDSILFDRDGYWPAVFHADFPIDHVESRDRDEEAKNKKTGIIEIDTVLAIKRGIHKHLGIDEGGERAKKRDGLVIVPLHRIGAAN